MMSQLQSLRRSVSFLVRTEFAPSRCAAMLLICSVFLPLTVPVVMPSAVAAPATTTSTTGANAAALNPGGPVAIDAKDGAASTSKATEMAALEASVKRVEFNREGQVDVPVGESPDLGVMLKDAAGKAVNGVKIRWRSSDESVLAINGDGRPFSVRVGRARLTAAAGNVSASISVNVVDPVVNHTAAAVSPKPQPAPAYSISDELLESLFTPQNNLGHPGAKTDAGAPSPGVAGRTRERPGAANFSFSVPMAGLPGRGLSAGAVATYNSRVWNKSTADSENIYDYDLSGSNWMGPGFSYGYGVLTHNDNTSPDTYTLTEADGTRHLLNYVSSGVYEARDNTFIRFAGSTSGGTVYYSDGTQILFNATRADLHGSTVFENSYPIKVTDRNGNYIELTYETSSTQYSTWLTSIKDTMGRYIHFYYDGGTLSNGSPPSGLCLFVNSCTPRRLIAVTVPGFDGGSDRIAARFYYDTMTFNNSEVRFDGPGYFIESSMRMLRYAYYPGTQTGFKYDYSAAYAMIRGITELRGMTVSNETSTTSMGSVTSDGQTAANTLYNYPTSVPSLDPLTDVPQYTTRTDTWSGQTTSASVYTFSVDDNPSGYTDRRITTVTAPDGSVTQSHRLKNPGQWNDGLLIGTVVKASSSGATLMVDTYAWEQGNGSVNYRMTANMHSNEATETKFVQFGYCDYGTSSNCDPYDNVRWITEHDFNGTSPGTQLRRTEFTYEHGTNWTNRRLLHLVKRQRVYDGSSLAAETEYDYDNGGTVTSSNPVRRSDIIMHDARFDPDSGSYSSAFDYRGNVTSVTSYANASAHSGANTNTVKYDIAGNAVEMSVNCCQKKAITYNKTYEYAYPVAQARGDSGQLSSSATYDFNTGLSLTGTAENGAVTSMTYDTASLRPTRSDRPDGGYTTFEYNDDLVADPDSSHMHSYVKTTTKLDSSRTVSGYQYFDGRGAMVRSFGPLTSSGYQGVTDTQYDIMGRPYRTSVPYYASGPTAAINSTGLWTTVTYDGLGRTLTTTAPGESTASSTITYAGTVITVTDQAGKSRRQVADALGRLIRVDEPNSSGALGTVSSPNQPTYYTFDVLDNLTEIDQTAPYVVTQSRKFKYDSLSQLIAEKSIEAAATLNDSGTKVGTSTGLWTNVYVYDSSGHLTDGYDARGVRAQLTYDGLNRVTQVAYSGEPSGQQTPTVSYAYDERANTTDKFNLGELTTVSTASTSYAPSTALTFDYDKLGRTWKKQQIIGTNGSLSSQTYAIQYAFNLAGKLSSETYPSGRVVSFTFDDAGRPSTIADGDRTYLSSPVYAGWGGATSVTLGNGDVQSAVYNDRLQLTQLNLMKDTTLLQRYNYAYGEVTQSTGSVDTGKNTGQIARIQGFIGGTTSSPTKQWEQRFSYDSLDRLETGGEYRGDTSALTYKSKFSYDRFGNRFRKATDNTTGSPSTNWVEDNQIDPATNRFMNATTGITYDEAGNVTADPKFRGLQYKYDANGRMIWSATPSNTQQADAVYDGMGQRIATKVGGVWRYMVYDVFGQMIAEYGGADSADAGGVHYQIADHQGSVRAVANDNGWIAGRHDYQPFGEEVGAGTGQRTIEQGYNAPDVSRQKYAMTERDEASGLDHTTWRKYEQNAGRWSSPDPLRGNIGNPQTFNAFTYSGNDPVNFVDPEGLEFRIPGLYFDTGAQVGWGDVSAGFWGMGNLMNRPRGMIGVPFLTDVPIYIIEAMAADVRAHTIYPKEGSPHVISNFHFAVSIEDYSGNDWQTIYTEALNVARSKLGIPICAMYFSEVDFAPLNRLNAINKGGISFSPNQKGHDGGLVEADWNPNNGITTFYPDFFTGMSTAFSGLQLMGYDIRHKALRPKEARAVIILHELKHALGQDHKDQADSDFWNGEIIRLCFS
jgi:RHS repeat-associated protein